MARGSEVGGMRDTYQGHKAREHKVHQTYRGTVPCSIWCVKICMGANIAKHPGVESFSMAGWVTGHKVLKRTVLPGHRKKWEAVWKADFRKMIQDPQGWMVLYSHNERQGPCHEEIKICIRHNGDDRIGKGSITKVVTFGLGLACILLVSNYIFCQKS